MPRTTAILLLLGASLADAAAMAEIEHRWSDAAKEAVGTAFGAKSPPVWFTAAHGILTEAYYPRADRAQVGDSQILIAGAGGTRFLEEKRDFERDVAHPPGAPRPIWRARWQSPSGTRVAFVKELLSDTARPALRIRYRFAELPGAARVYLLHKPAAENDGAHDMARALGAGKDAAIVAWDAESAATAYQAVVVSAEVRKASIGRVGESDGWQDLSRHGRMVHEIPENGPGNLAATEELVLPASHVLEIALGFGPSARDALAAAKASLATPFDTIQSRYDAGWRAYLRALARAPWLAKLPEDLRGSLLWDAAVLKAHEDKRHPGAIVASLSVPHLPDGDGAPDGKNTGGYHLVWPRDLFKAALALLRLGDARTALDALRFMARMERTSARGGVMSQNTWVDGRPFWDGIQMDQEAFPVLLACELRDAGVPVDGSLTPFLERRLAHLRASSGFTGQDRWEEAHGFSPNTLAVMAAALACTGDRAGAERLARVALDRSVSRRGPLSPRPYFIRIAQTGEPDAGHELPIANGGPSVAEYRILDGGFLEWLRWFPRSDRAPGGVVAELSSVIRATLPLYDDPANGVAAGSNGIPLYRRYTADAYGVGHRGGPWPILTAERALAEPPDSWTNFVKMLHNLYGPGDLCPEQLVRRDGDAAPMPWAAAPLVWCHAEAVELAFRASH